MQARGDFFGADLIDLPVNLDSRFSIEVCRDHAHADMAFPFSVKSGLVTRVEMALIDNFQRSRIESCLHFCMQLFDQGGRCCSLSIPIFALWLAFCAEMR